MEGCCVEIIGSGVGGLGSGVGLFGSGVGGLEFPCVMGAVIGKLDGRSDGVERLLNGVNGDGGRE